MRVRYTTTPEDMVVFNQYWAETSPTIRRMRRRVATTISVAALALGGVVDLTTRRLLFAPAAILFVLVFLRLYRREQASAVERIQRQISSEGRNAAVFCEHTLEITPDALIERSAVNESRTVWSGIEKIARTDGHAFIFTQATAAHVVPRHRLDEGDFDSFVRAAEEALSRAQTTVASG